MGWKKSAKNLQELLEQIEKDDLFNPEVGIQSNVYIVLWRLVYFEIKKQQNILTSTCVKIKFALFLENGRISTFPWKIDKISRKISRIAGTNWKSCRSFRLSRGWCPVKCVYRVLWRLMSFKKQKKTHFNATWVKIKFALFVEKERISTIP